MAQQSLKAKTIISVSTITLYWRKRKFIFLDGGSENYPSAPLIEALSSLLQTSINPGRWPFCLPMDMRLNSSDVTKWTLSPKRGVIFPKLEMSFTNAMFKTISPGISKKIVGQWPELIGNSRAGTTRDTEERLCQLRRAGMSCPRQTQPIVLKFKKLFLVFILKVLRLAQGHFH